MPLMTWADEYSVGIPSIDEQHKKLMAILNDLHDGMQAQKSREVLASVFAKLLSYTVEHFAYEENFFDKTNYPLSGEHKSEHASLKEKAIELQKRFEASQSGILSIETMGFLRDWLIKHIQGSDKKYSAHLISAGVM